MFFYSFEHLTYYASALSETISDQLSKQYIIINSHDSTCTTSMNQTDFYEEYVLLSLLRIL